MIMTLFHGMILWSLIYFVGKYCQIATHTMIHDDHHHIHTTTLCHSTNLPHKSRPNPIH